jgi:hypothetical protein
MYTECRHIMPSGKKCHSPALRDKHHCYYHHNLQRLADPASRAAKELPVLAIEDARGIQIALAQVLGALNSPYMDTRRAGLLLYGLSLASNLTSRIAALEPSECVRDLPSGNETEPLAPVINVCEPPLDCFLCNKYEHCKKPEKIDKDDYEVIELEDEENQEQDEAQHQTQGCLRTSPADPFATRSSS